MEHEPARVARERVTRELLESGGADVVLEIKRELLRSLEREGATREQMDGVSGRHLPGLVGGDDGQAKVPALDRVIWDERTPEESAAAIEAAWRRYNPGRCP